MTSMDAKDPARKLAALVDAQCLGVRVGRLQRLVSRRFAEALRPHGVTLPQLEILSVLSLQKAPRKPAAMAEEMALERSTLSRNLALMAECGWVDAPGSSPGGRTLAVQITREGKKKLLDAGSAWRRAQAELAKKLGADAPRELDGWLERLRQ